MLPGIRFLLAAIVLCFSILIFGLGAAALLRAAHEEFASIPSRRAVLSEPVFARPAGVPPPTLAMLRVEPVNSLRAPDTPPAALSIAEPAPEAVPVAKVETEWLAAVKPEDVAPAMAETTAKPEGAAPEAAAAALPAAAPAETKVAALDISPPAATESAPTQPEPVAPAAAAIDRDIATIKTAALGNPSEKVAKPAEATGAKPDRSEIRKQRRAERAKERRRQAARRARLAAQQAAAVQQQPAGPFSEAIQPTQQAATTRRRR